MATPFSNSANRTAVHLLNICIDWNISGPTDDAYYTILPAAWVPRARYTDQPTTFAMLQHYPGTAAVHPTQWTSKYAEELRRFTLDTRNRQDEGWRLLESSARARCNEQGGYAAAEITTGDIKKALAVWRSGETEAQDGEELRQDLVEILECVAQCKEQAVQTDGAGEMAQDEVGQDGMGQADQDFSLVPDTDEMTSEFWDDDLVGEGWDDEMDGEGWDDDEDVEGGVVLSRDSELVLPVRLKKQDM